MTSLYHSLSIGDGGQLGNFRIFHCLEDEIISQKIYLDRFTKYSYQKWNYNDVNRKTFYEYIYNISSFRKDLPPCEVSIRWEERFVCATQKLESKSPLRISQRPLQVGTPTSIYLNKDAISLRNFTVGKIQLKSWPSQNMLRQRHPTFMERPLRYN